MDEHSVKFTDFPGITVMSKQTRRRRGEDQSRDDGQELCPAKLAQCGPRLGMCPRIIARPNSSCQARTIPPSGLFLSTPKYSPSSYVPLISGGAKETSATPVSSF
ncbi:hypothetical protein KM043_006997 [Ampulex compressa]|nr:hypothetical protein KM043_006997 [Ampulex compressa]